MDGGKRGGRDRAAFPAFALRVEPQVRLAASRINRGRKMKRPDFMPQEIEAPWWQRYGAAAEIEFNLLPASKSLHRWAFDYEGAFVRRYHGYSVFWLRGWVCVLGLRVGAGVFRRGAKLPEPLA